MKLTKRIKTTRALPTVNRYGFTKISRLFKPVGYYYNRPNVSNPYRQTEIGCIESVRFIVSPTME